jgi:hypothetical protein
MDFTGEHDGGRIRQRDQVWAGHAREGVVAEPWLVDIGLPDDEFTFGISGAMASLA